jgi:molybdopterin-synthase adenylyltransferase
MMDNRYIRHRPLLDNDAWSRMAAVPVVIAGAGGLGSHVLTSLARLAPLTLEIWDPGILDEPDLNRQILYMEADLGRRKTEAAAEHLLACNSALTLHLHPEKLTAESFFLPDAAAERASQPSADAPLFVIFDCLDSFEARYELELIRRRYSVPLFHGGVEGWYGQAATFLPGSPGFTGLLGPEFRHLPKAAKPILPQTVAAVASFQVGEYVHWCLNPDKTPLSEALLVYDGKSMKTDLITLSPEGEEQYHGSASV